ncbi:hypothetical protein ACIRO1_45440 [Streptomyces sp. NPDC102381]|uniref:hypothetical protein n=1 Tax=Streptomyces sp. NPDC102381 TaxID=3366164 RepID=UPI0037FAC547
MTIALVDRTSAAAEDAAEMLYQSRTRSDADLSLPAVLSPPHGIEVLAWHKKRGPA